MRNYHEYFASYFAKVRPANGSYDLETWRLLVLQASHGCQNLASDKQAQACRGEGQEGARVRVSKYKLSKAKKIL